MLLLKTRIRLGQGLFLRNEANVISHVIVQDGELLATAQTRGTGINSRCEDGATTLILASVCPVRVSADSG